MKLTSVETYVRKHEIQRRTFTCLSLYCVFLLASCESNKTFFHQYKSVDTSGWEGDDTLVYHLPPSSKHQVMSAELGVRSTDAFRYNTLFVIGTLEKDGHEISSDTLFINIYGRDGAPLGKGLLFPTCTQSIPSFEVDSGVEYTYTVRQFMKAKKLEGVKDVGLKLCIEE